MRRPFKVKINQTEMSIYKALRRCAMLLELRNRRRTEMLHIKNISRLNCGWFLRDRMHLAKPLNVTRNLRLLWIKNVNNLFSYRERNKFVSLSSLFPVWGFVNLILRISSHSTIGLIYIHSCSILEIKGRPYLTL